MAKLTRKVGWQRFHNYAHQLVEPRTDGGGGFSPAEMAALYGVPKLVVDNYDGCTIQRLQDQWIALLELGGGYSLQAIAQIFNQWGLPTPNIVDLSVDGARNNYTGDPNSADVEVELDICCAAGVWSYATGRPANILILFCPNSDSGFLHGIQAVYNNRSASPSTSGISWGQNEDQWTRSSIAIMDEAFSAGSASGVTYCCASGDAGDSDGGAGKHCDYPSSSPSVVACGGTTIVAQGGTITNETPWNASGGASGGGYSDLEGTPEWQSSILGITGRGVPDLCMAADPATGWQTPFGMVGGTSAVAPATAAFFALCNMVREAKKLPRLGLVNPLLYQNHDLFFDITAGNNTRAKPRFSAGPGWDRASGLGALRGAELFTILTSGAAPAPPSPPSPPSPPPPTQLTLRQRFTADFTDLRAGKWNPGQQGVWKFIQAYIDQALALNPRASGLGALRGAELFTILTSGQDPMSAPGSAEGSR